MTFKIAKLGVLVCPLLIVVSLFTVKISFATSEEVNQTDEQIQKWLNDISKINIPDLPEEHQNMLNSILSMTGELFPYFGSATNFSLNSHSNLINLAQETKNLSIFKKEFVDAVENADFENGPWEDEKELISYFIDQCPMAYEYGFFNAEFDSIATGLCKYIQKKWTRLLKRDQVINDFKNTVLKKCISTFTHAETNIIDNASQNQLNLSRIFWFTSVILIYQDYHYLESLKEQIAETEELIQKHIINNQIDLTVTTALLTEVNEVSSVIMAFLLHGHNKLKEFEIRVLDFKSSDQRQNFIAISLPKYMNEVERNRIEADIKLNKIQTKIDNTLGQMLAKQTACESAKKTCKNKAVGQGLLGVANTYGAWVSYAIGNSFAAALHGVFAGANVYLSVDAVRQFLVIQKKIGELKQIRVHYIRVSQQVEGEKGRILMSIDDFTKELEKAKHNFLEPEMLFSWD